MKPGELLIGLRELFAFVVPGVAFLLLLPHGLQRLIDVGYGATPLLPDSETARLLVFFFVAYAVGASLSGVGATFDHMAERFGGRRRFLPGWRETVAEAAALQQLAAGLEEVAARSLPVRPVAKAWGKRAFWWTWLRIHCPACVAEVDRLEAQQKLFRSLLVAMLVLAVLHRDPLASSLFLLGAVICFVHYAGLRQLLTRRLFQSAVIQFVPGQLHGLAPAADQPGVLVQE